MGVQLSVSTAIYIQKLNNRGAKVYKRTKSENGGVRLLPEPVGEHAEPREGVDRVLAGVHGGVLVVERVRLFVDLRNAKRLHPPGLRRRRSFLHLRRVEVPLVVHGADRDIEEACMCDW